MKNKNIEWNNEKLNTGGTLNEYQKLGNYHAELKLSHRWLPRYLRRFHIVKEILHSSLPTDAKIADIGGGEGILIEKLHDEGFEESIGIDPYAPLTNEYMKKGSILEIPFEDNSLDAVTCLDVLEHIPLHLQEQACQELYRILNEQGFVIISVPNMAHLKSRIDFLLKGKPWRNKLEKHPGELSIHERIQVLEKVGFYLLDSVGIHLTLNYDPSPSGVLGKARTRLMFSANVPTDLCWTTMILLSKGKDSTVAQKFQGNRLLRKFLKSYIPDSIDPTYSAFN